MRKERFSKKISGFRMFSGLREYEGTEQSVPYTRYEKYIRVVDMRQKERQGNTNVRF